jgi:hypothetical protein
MYDNKPAPGIGPGAGEAAKSPERIISEFPPLSLSKKSTVYLFAASGGGKVRMKGPPGFFSSTDIDPPEPEIVAMKSSPWPLKLGWTIVNSSEDGVVVEVKENTFWISVCGLLPVLCKPALEPSAGNV